MIHIIENQLSLEEYLGLRASVCWKVLQKEQAEKALQNSIYTVCAYDGDQPVGMGRVVGDGAVIVYIQDLVVHPEHQGQGVGRKIMEQILQFVRNMNPEGNEMMLCLMCAKGRESFYQKFGFLARPTDALGPGMIQYIGGEPI